MICMFYEAKFNQDISQLDIRNVKDLQHMFVDCYAKQPWWYIEDNKLREKTIDNFNLSSELSEILVHKNISYKG